MREPFDADLLHQAARAGVDVLLGSQFWRDSDRRQPYGLRELFPEESAFYDAHRTEARRALLRHLLEAEAAERVKVSENEHGVTFGGIVSVIEENEILYLPNGDPFDWLNITGDEEELILCLAAGLAEKRRREGGK